MHRAITLFLTGALLTLAASARDLDLLSNEVLSAQAPESPPDVILDPDVDLQAYVEATLSLKADAYVAPLIVPASDANADSQNSNYFYSFSNGRYSAGDGCHMAPVYLPHGNVATTVTIENFFVFAYDNDPIGNTTYLLRRVRNDGSSASEIIGTVTTVGAGTSIQVLGDTSIANPEVTNNLNYFVSWCFTGTEKGVQGFWIFYTES